MQNRRQGAELDVAPDADDLKTLLPQAQAILELAVSGQTDKQIAQEIGLSIHTVDYHWRHIRNRYGVSSRTAIVARYLASRKAIETPQRPIVQDLQKLRSWPS